ncbi:hypothetical protein [uncultured Mameliella sp.]|uniref:hypothetical protein n=1 Tax=uncultured Mameliella sp. TaxID=1447087 RepID=UPI00262CD016|nr:hypothetical protein [uncultured Mameliella sp.]
MRRLISGTSLAMIWMAGTAFAGPVADFESEFREMYADYRTALFMTNSGNREKSGASLKALGAGWSAIKLGYATTPPPQYEDDPQWGEVIAEVDALLAEAGAEVSAGELVEAHDTLEGVREVFSALHLRNGVQTFSDRMNAYHAEMEHVLAIDPATVTKADLPGLTGQAAVLAYLADEVAAHPPAEAREDETFAKLLKALQDSVQALNVAARAGDIEALRAAMAGLKKPYSKLFLKFG